MNLLESGEKSENLSKFLQEVEQVSTGAWLEYSDKSVPLQLQTLNWLGIIVKELINKSKNFDMNSRITSSLNKISAPKRRFTD
jgi:hypothetical protein